MAGRLDALGIDGGAYLEATGSVERLALVRRAEVAEELLAHRDENLAIRITNSVVKALSG